MKEPGWLAISIVVLGFAAWDHNLAGLIFSGFATAVFFLREATAQEEGDKSE